jgi:hypothetical protein
MNRKKSCVDGTYNILYIEKHNPNKILNNSMKHSNDSIKNPNNSNNEMILSCNYCNKKFSSSSNVTRHLKNFCKTKNNHENEKEKIYQKLLKELDEQKIEVKKLKDLIKNQDMTIKDKDCTIKDKDITIKNLSVNNITNNTSNNTSNNTLNNNSNNNSNNKIVNNITINAFGKEDTSYITDKEYKEIFYSSSKSVPKLISKIHFNKKYPENSNIYISNLKDSYIMVFDGKTWNMSMKTETIDQIFDSKIIHLDGVFADQLAKLDPTVKKRFKRFQYNLEHSSVEHDIKKELKLLLYNSRILALKNKKKTEIAALSQ